MDNSLDIVIAAVEGDWVEVGMAGIWGNAAVNGYLDAVSVVAGSPVTSWGTDAAPDNTHAPSQWVGVASRFDPISGSLIRRLDAGDVSGGNLTLRVRYRTLSATNKVLFAVTATPFVFWAHNLLQP